MVLSDVAGFAVRDRGARRIAGGRAQPANVTLIGSSLGGYFATYLAEKHGWPAVLLNPAVVPQRDLSAYLGEQPLWHGVGSIVVEPHHLDELRALGVASITQPERYYLMAATGDEVLDYREMLAHYPGARTTLIEGSDHAISEFAQYVDDVLAFATPKTSSRRRRARLPECWAFQQRGDCRAPDSYRRRRARIAPRIHYHEHVAVPRTQ